MQITRRGLTFGLPLAAAASTMTRRARGADTSPIIIGYPAALTGPSSAPGVGQNRGVTYIVEQINAAGGVKGRKIEMVTRDTQGDPTKAVNAVQEMMANNHVHAIFGPNNSGEALATTPIIARRGIPNIHCCGITSLIDEKKFPNAFRQTPNNDQRPIRRVSIVRRSSRSPRSRSSAIAPATALPLSPIRWRTSRRTAVTWFITGRSMPRQPDMMPDMLRMRDAGAQAIVIWTVSTGMIARLLNARGSMGWDVPFVGHQAMGSGEVGASAAEAGILAERFQYGLQELQLSARR